MAYIRAEKVELDRKAQLSYAEEKGREEGIEEGKIQTAINLKKNGMPIEKIAKSTGWTVEFIEKL